MADCAVDVVLINPLENPVKFCNPFSCLFDLTPLAFHVLFRFIKPLFLYQFHKCGNVLIEHGSYGKYPVEAVKTMTKVAAQAEKDKLADNDIRIPLDENSNDVTAFLAKQAVKATTKLKIRAIITDSYSGRTARNLAAFRGKYPVLAICYKEKTMRHLALSYGVEAIYMPELANGQEYYFAALRRLLQEGRLQPTDMVGYLSSGKAGTQTSFLEINVVEDALKHAEDSVLPNSNRYL